MNDIKPRTVYLMRRTNRPDDGTEIYVGSTSQTLNERLCKRKSETQRKGNVNKSKLYTRVIEIGVNNCEITPLLSRICEKDIIRKVEKKWCDLLNADLNSYSPFSDKKRV